MYYNLLNSGIYCIKNIINNKVYIGCSVQLDVRLNKHWYMLRNNKHDNKKLQNAYNKYGKENFISYIIEYVEENNLLETEKLWITYFNSFNNGYNQVPFSSIVANCKKSIKLIDPEGNVVEADSQSDLSKKIGLNMTAISYLSIGKYKSMHGYRLYSKDLVGQIFKHNDNWKNMIKRNSKSFSLINPDGAIICGNNMSEFCRQNNLSVCGISSLMTGRLERYRGYKKFVENK